MTTVNIKELNKSYGAHQVLQDINLDINAGEFVVFVGPSGCGKSTLLRTIAGLEEVSSGEIHIDSQRVDGLSPAKRQIAMVFQSYALYPHMSVHENMGFGLRMAKMAKEKIKVRVREAAEMLHVEQYLDRLPKQLSGGQRQRVAIGRAITRDPKVFLFDEPLSNLDAGLRAGTRVEIAKLKQRMPDTTMIYVTHDQVEAMTLADRIVVLNKGRIEQIGRPLELYHQPANKFVAGFVGSPSMNFFDAKIEKSSNELLATTGSGDALTLPSGTSVGTSDKVTLGIRPEHLKIGGDDPVVARGEVDLVENLGDLAIVHVSVSEGQTVVVKSGVTQLPDMHAKVTLNSSVQNLHLFGSDGTLVAKVTGRGGASVH